ncbi:MAG: ketol-acid reductoisomerase, partial [Chloroflexi bacterium]
MKMYYDSDCPPTLGEKVAILGYGSQGRAHALNLRDSGEDVTVGLYPGSRSKDKAEADGVRVKDVPEAVKDARVVMVLTPDVGQARLYREAVEPNLKRGDMLMFAHGFSIHFG